MSQTTLTMKSRINEFLNQLKVFQVRNPTNLSSERVISVDALRGFDMFWIMGGDMMFQGLDSVFHNKITAFLKLQTDHVEWLGFHFYDIIMPLFLFLVGVSLVFSTRKRISQGATDKSIWMHTIKRVIILWILGMAVQGNLLTYDINQIRLYSNTLQAIASGYLVATIFVLYLPVLYQLFATLGLLVAYWAILVLIPVGGNPLGSFTMESNAALSFDHWVLGRFHDGLQYTWILTSLGFTATVMLGVFCGYMLQSNADQMKKFRNFILLGASLIILALIWDQWHPIIKKVWTGSFTLFAGGISILMLAFFYLIIDIWKNQKGTKWLIILGSNAIFGYVAWHLLESGFVTIAAVFLDGLKPVINDWYQTLSYLGGFMVIFLLMRYMYYNKTFIKI
jgi:predicted acyltransferase